MHAYVLASRAREASFSSAVRVDGSSKAGNAGAVLTISRGETGFARLCSVPLVLGSSTAGPGWPDHFRKPAVKGSRLPV